MITWDRLIRWHERAPGWRIRSALLEHTPGLPDWTRAFPHTWLSRARLLALSDHVAHAAAADVPGVFMECGVARGGSALLLGLRRNRLAPTRELWLCDTFEGLPPPTANDPDYSRAVAYTGTCRGELSEVQALLGRHGVTERVRFVKGLYENTLAQLEVSPIAVLHLDSDWYDPTLLCLQALWPRVSPGGRVQFDDYLTWQGCYKAVHDFFGVSLPTIHPIDEGAMWIEKPNT